MSGIDGDFTRAWDMTLGDRSEPIAVVDTGVDFSLADLSVNAAGHDHDWIDGDEDAAPGPAGAQLPSDASHGTHVAGIAAAALTVNQPSGDVTGGAPGAGITALRVLDTDGSGWSSDVAAAFAWAAEHGARVVNASLSGIGPSPAVANAIAAHPETLFVVAAGNGDDNGVGYDEDARGRGRARLPVRGSGSQRPVRGRDQQSRRARELLELRRDERRRRRGGRRRPLLRPRREP